MVHSGTVIVGLSGGVDSAVTALLLKNSGYNVIGVTMAVWQKGKYDAKGKGGCFAAEKEDDAAAAKALCEKLGIEYHLFDCADEYQKIVLNYFRDEYLAGRTPNPCVKCNALLKFGLLPQKAREAGIEYDYFATGHYARTDFANGRYRLLRAVDTFKDQSYFLYRLSQEHLKRQLFPLGGLTKPEVRAIAVENGFQVADKPDSQDFYGGDRNDIIGEPDRPGNIVDQQGNVLGKHKGFWHYTIGQRKGLCISNPVPLYVIDINACRNEVVVGPVESTVCKRLIADDCNWISIETPSDSMDVQVKVRSAGQPIEGCTIYPMPDGRIEARFDRNKIYAANSGGHTPGTGVAPGQSAVFFDGDVVLGGGIITESE